MGTFIRHLILISSLLCDISLAAITGHNAVCGKPPHSKERNSVLTAVHEAGSRRQFLTNDDDILHAPGSLAAYTCVNQIEYKFADCPAITCLPNGTWSGSQPKCEAKFPAAPTPSAKDSGNYTTEIQCRSPPVNNETWLATPSHLTKTILLYQCNKREYQLVGCPVLVCNTSDGSWIGAPPTCVKNTSNTSETLDDEVTIRPLPNPRKPIPYNMTRGVFDPYVPFSSSSVTVKLQQCFVLFLITFPMFFSL